jgi:hypothetical protein
VTTVSEEEREGSSLALERAPESTAPTRACAREGTPLPSASSLQAATRRARAVHRLAARAGEFLDRPGSLVHAHPPAFAAARERHHEAAARHEMIPVLGAVRLAWGYAHLLLIKPVLNFLEWVTETPLRFFAAIALVFIVWFWS